MKRGAIILLIPFIGILVSLLSQKVYAQGTCVCSINQYYRACKNSTNSCSTGYQPQCAVTQCYGDPQSCTCVQTTPQNCLKAGSSCSSSTAACCDPFSCSHGYCAASTPTPPATTPEIQSTCQYVTDTTQNGYCIDCTKKNGVWTAIGCITTDPKNLLGTIISLALGLAGGIAFLLILFGGLQIMTSAGNPEQLNAGRELITSAIIGLILILFSVFLLQFIGVNIIGIPNFS